MAHILVIDDETAILRLFEDLFGDEGHSVVLASTAQEGLSAVIKGEFDLVITDVRLPDGDGLELLPQLLSSSGSPEVIIMTGYGDPDGAELAITKGAWDYLEKPPSINQVMLAVKRALQYRQSKQSKPVVSLKREGLLGQSHAIKACLDSLTEAAAGCSPVLITGPTGTGKELFARLLHHNSSRAGGPFVVADCASIPEKLVESHFFGHVKGAFTGADRSAKGLIKQAHEGTLFLDEIGELPFGMQRSLLRVLETMTFRPVGSDTVDVSDFRLVAATNRDLDAMVKNGNFRQDLFFRIQGFHISLPRLVDRKGDIRLIANHHIQKVCRQHDLPAKAMGPDFLRILERHQWPGNVRELLHLIEGAVLRAGEETELFTKHLPMELRVLIARSSVKSNAPQDMPEGVSTLSSFREHRRQAIDKIEKNYLEALIAESAGSLSEAMGISELGKTRLYNLLKKHDLSLKD